VSGVYNALCRWLFGIRVTDLNSVKAYRREVMEVVPTRPDWHRFMVVIAAAQGFRLAERPVPLHPRRAGQSKFGIGRIPVGVLDLLSVWFQLRFGRKPLLFFGVSGAVLFTLGFLVAAALVYRFAFGVGSAAFDLDHGARHLRRPPPGSGPRRDGGGPARAAPGGARGGAAAARGGRGAPARVTGVSVARPLRAVRPAPSS
jgi:hypothetical protein